MLVSKVSLLFDMFTSPSDTTVASSHGGGLSENYWTVATGTILDNSILNLATNRALILPEQANVIGWRVSVYDVQGNKQVPQASFSTNRVIPGNTNWTTDVPQMALLCRFLSAGSVNKTLHSLRVIPDIQVAGGEFSPSRAFRIALSNFFATIRNGQWGFVGRVLTNGSVRCAGLAGPTLTTDGALPGAAVNKFVRFLRVYDDNRQPVTGTFRITAVGLGNTYTLDPAPGFTVSRTSGLVRIDELNFFTIGNTMFERVNVRKVGRPFELYRGRRAVRR